MNSNLTRKLRRAFTALTLVGVLVFLSGCVSPKAQPEAMIATLLPDNHTIPEPVFITVRGGKDADPMHPPTIGNEEFRTAVRESLRKCSLFKSVLDSPDPGYRLDTVIEYQDQPTVGLKVTVSLRVDWKLTRDERSEVVWHEKILTTHTATPGDAFVAVKRVRLANEAASRKNIEQALAKIAALEL